MNCLFKPKIKPMEITEFTEFDILQNKIRLSNEHISIITNSFKERSRKIKNLEYNV